MIKKSAIKLNEVDNNYNSSNNNNKKCKAKSVDEIDFDDMIN